MSNYLIHYGVKGMKWGVRKDETQGESRSSDKKHSNGIEDFYNNTKRTDRYYRDVYPPGGVQELRWSEPARNFYKDQGLAIEKYFKDNNKDAFTGDRSAYYVKSNSWKKSSIYAESKGHWMYDGPMYTPSKIPDAYYLACTNELDYNGKELQQILAGNYLITDDLIDEAERLAVNRARDFEINMDTAGKSLTSMIQGKEGPVGTKLSYKDAYIAGNNAIELQRTANALKAAKKAQRSDPVKFVKALCNEVKYKTQKAARSIKESGKSFINKLFKRS